MIETISELQKNAQLNANKHGWVAQWNIFNTPPQPALSQCLIQSRTLSIGDALALIHSEVSEAFEELDNEFTEGHNVAFELADIMIRIFHLTGDLCYTALENDLAHRVGTQEKFLTQIQHLAYMAICAENDGINNKSTSYILCQINKKISQVLEAYRDDKQAAFNWRIVETIVWTLYLGERLGYNLTEAINAKMEKNKSRPRNHGRVNL